MQHADDGSGLEYQDIAYDHFVRARQGSLEMELPRNGGEFELEPTERRLISTSSHFFLSTVTGTGWPYVQHRGGPAGFVHILGPTRLGWLEFAGNRQFVSTGNVDRDGRVCLFFIDYPTRSRLKVFGTAHIVERDDDPELMERLRRVGGGEIRSPYQRAMLVDATATDANCAKYITPRHTREQVEERIDLYRRDIDELRGRVAELEGELAALRGDHAGS